MIVNVRMLAFMDGELRPVNVPDEEIAGREDDIDLVLEKVFYFGQNDFQSMMFCSVSVGDVAHLYGKFFVCGRFGWKELSPQQYQDYEKIERRDRGFCDFVK